MRAAPTDRPKSTAYAWATPNAPVGGIWSPGWPGNSSAGPLSVRRLLWLRPPGSPSRSARAAREWVPVDIFVQDEQAS
jgi:hypothetical protein